MGRMIGIDLGTTNSVVAIVDGPMPRVLDNREGKPQTRSVVSLKKRRGAKAGDAGEILVGDPALDNWDMAPKDTVISIKRLMGRAVTDPEVQKVQKVSLCSIVEPFDGTTESVRVVVGGKQYSPIEVSALILRKLKEDAEYRLGEEVTHAVITVPAYFSQIQRDATRKAGLKAGLKVMKILEEPTAAAIAFGVDSGESTEPKTILVYDLGGGTFDISVLMWAGNVFAPLNLEGDMWLGGDNFDQVLVDHAVRHVKEEYGIDPTSNMRFMVVLKKAAQAVKERLSSARAADLIVAGMLHDDSGNLIDVELEITREELERMIQPLVERTVSLTKKALKNAGYTAEQIDYVLMAGNCTTVPLVQQAMEEIFGPEKVMRKIHPKHSVAMGAALLAARLRGVVCQAPDPADPKRECGHLNKPEATTCAACGASFQLEPAPPVEGVMLPDVISGIAPFCYGTQTAGDKFNVFIKKNDPFPTQDPQAQTFYTRTPNQRMISIPVYGGDNLEKASANEKQGEAFAILPPGLPQDTVVRIKVWLDSDGVFDLTAHLEDGTDLRPWVQKGEKDAKAIGAIEKVEQVLAQKGAAISPEEMHKLEEARNRAFEQMRQGDFEGALQQAQVLGEMAEEAGQEEERDALRIKAENLIAYTEFVLQQYGWGLDPNQSYRLNNLVEETKSALASGKRTTLEEKVVALDQATDNLPDAIRVFLGVRGAIAARIRPVDPALAAALLADVDEVENAFRSRNPAAGQKLEALAAKVTEAIKKAKTPVAIRCSRGHEVPPGERYCPEPGCNDDTWTLVSKASATTTTGEFKRK